MQTGGQSGAAFNAAKEIALDHFIGGAIGFADMAGLVEETLAVLSRGSGLQIAPTCLEDVARMDADARQVAGRLVARLTGAA